MKHLFAACMGALLLSGCGQVGDKFGELAERGRIYAERIRVLIAGEDVPNTNNSDQDGTARAASDGPAAPDNAPLLPARLAFGADGWFVWASWHYHQSGLVCAPKLGEFTFSRARSGDDAAAWCTYYGTEFQTLRLSHDGKAEAYGEAAVLSREFGNASGGALRVECECESPRHDAAFETAAEEARRAQLAFDKRDRLSGAT